MLHTKCPASAERRASGDAKMVWVKEGGTGMEIVLSMVKVSGREWTVGDRSQVAVTLREKW